MEHQPKPTVLILGAGINGCALARELVLNRVAVWLVDSNDIAFGATSKSSRLIHGGLRYLEYGDFGLVRESLEERSRLLKLAPQFVEPLRLYIPVRRRTGGLFRSVFRFVGGSRIGLLNRLFSRLTRNAQRGLWLVRLGLWFYDWLASSDDFPKHTVVPTASQSAPQIDADTYPWLCAYSDAQMHYPERFVLALLEDARQLAHQNGVDFRVFTHHHATFREETAEIRRVGGEEEVLTLRPSLVVNATGAWGDLTLEDSGVQARRLFGGTKGSHFVSHNRRLREALGDAGLYAEADDGRLVFVLPFGESVLVGTTDEKFDDRPEHAIASPHELTYLIEMVNQLFPNVGLTDADVEMHYSGIRPLPYVASEKTASIPRGHWIKTHKRGGMTILTLVGGKLTTCRALAEIAADIIFLQLNVARTENSRERFVPGGEHYPDSPAARKAECERLATLLGLTVQQVNAVWSLYGSRAEAVLRDCVLQDNENLSDTDFTLPFVRWLIEHEWVTTLDDLVERRLMLIYHSGLTEQCLRQLAVCLVETNRLEASQIDAAVAATVDRLRTYYGKTIVADHAPLTTEP